MADAPPFQLLLGRYQIGGFLGEGGFADVWEVLDTTLGVPRAVKVLRVAGSRAARRRLQAEARAMALLQHPHVLRVHDVGEVDGRDFIVMDLAPGGPLDARVGLDGVDPALAVRWTRELLSALSAAHARGIVHRDIKPSNLLLGLHDEVLLADFGIARFSSDVHLTRTGVAMGTALFMAPEQRVDARSAGPAADLYAAGGTLYHLLTGGAPADLFAAPLDSPRWLGVPEVLIPIIAQATRYAPEERFPDAAAMSAALEAAAATLPPPGPLPSRRSRPSAPQHTPTVLDRPRPAATPILPSPRPGRRSRTRWELMVAGVFGAFVVVGVWAVPRAIRPPPPSPPVVADAMPSPTPLVPPAPMPEPASPPVPTPAVTPARVAVVARPTPAPSVAAGRYTGVFNRMLDAELVLGGPDDALTGSFVTRSGSRVGEPRAFTSPVAGRFDPATSTVTLEDTRDDATAGRYVLVLSDDRQRLEGAFDARHRDQHVPFSLRRP